MSRMCSYRKLQAENRAFAGTGGVSENNRAARFVPAFKDTSSGRVELPRMPDGSVAPMHLLSGLPEEWAADRDGDGRVTALSATIIAGFVRDGEFYTREQAAALT